MHDRHTVLSLVALLSLSLPVAAQQKAATPQAHWVATWTSAQQVPRAGFARPAAAPPAATGTPAVTTPAAPAGTAPAPPTPPAPTLAPNATGAVPPAQFTPRPARGFNDQTLRMVFHASLGGSQIRVHLSNAYGSAPLAVGAAHVALHGVDSAIVPASDRALTFGGSGSVTIPVGAEMISDPVALNVPKLADLAVSVFVPGDTGPADVHSLGLHTTWIAKGDLSAAPEFTDAEKTQSWYWVSEVDVQAAAPAATIIAFGDSITDGATSTPDTDRSWPSYLAQRIAANPATANIAVANQGISGNKVLSDGAGVSALARFDRDVLAVPGAKWLMILEGINDMNGAARPLPGTAPITADDLIAAMKQMIIKAHDHGIQVIGCTLTPFGNATDKVEAMRTALNDFIRNSGAFDKVVDFDAVIRDPASPRQFKAGYNNTDKLHPNDTGYKAMADAIDLSMFAPQHAATRPGR
jgi:lysophospholipase L1-like esterase